MSSVKGTPFTSVYNSFFSKITDDFYMELTELDTYRILQDLLISALQKFEFPRQNLDYELVYYNDITEYAGVESNFNTVPLLVYSGGNFKNCLSDEEINIIAIYMVVEWLSQQLASIENTRMKYSGSDFKFTSQGSHMQKIQNMKSDYEREGFHMQRVYKRRAINENGVLKPTMTTLMEPLDK